jgi:hypothetical protein
VKNRREVHSWPADITEGEGAMPLSPIYQDSWISGYTISWNQDGENVLLIVGSPLVTHCASIEEVSRSFSTGIIECFPIGYRLLSTTNLLPVKSWSLQCLIASVRHGGRIGV